MKSSEGCVLPFYVTCPDASKLPIIDVQNRARVIHLLVAILMYRYNLMILKSVELELKVWNRNCIIEMVDHSSQL